MQEHIVNDIPTSDVQSALASGASVSGASVSGASVSGSGSFCPFRLERTADLQRFRLPDDLRSPNEPDLKDHAPDAHWLLIHDAHVRARCSLWWRGMPCHAGRQAGAIGHFAATDVTAGTALLAHAFCQLEQRGCELAVGPMDGNTWRSYRLPTTGGGRPPFLLEPQNCDVQRDSFRAAGCQPLLTYFSAVVSNPSGNPLKNGDRHLTDCVFPVVSAVKPEPVPVLQRAASQESRVARIEQRLRMRGVSVRRLHPGRLQDELVRLYRVARIAFRANPLFIDVGEDGFLRQFLPLAESVPLDWILVAEHKSQAGTHAEPIGFVFAIPDLLQKQRQSSVDTLIIKTLAVVPQTRFGGLGRVLLEQVQTSAFRAGFCEVIHALVRETPQLQRISSDYAKPFRRYCLFARTLGGRS